MGEDKKLETDTHVQGDQPDCRGGFPHPCRRLVLLPYRPSTFDRSVVQLSPNRSIPHLTRRVVRVYHFQPVRINARLVSHFFFVRQPPVHQLESKRSSNALRRSAKEGLFIPIASTDEFGCEDGDSCSEVLHLFCPHSVYKEEGQLSGSTLHSQIEDWRKGGSKFVAKIVEEADEIEELDEGKYHVLFEVVVRQRVRPKTAVHLNGRAEGKAATTYRAAGEEDKDRAADGRERPAAVGERVLKLIGEDRTLAREADERILITATKQAITKKKDPNTEMENAAAIEKNRIERVRE
ncbi:hypothetical protein BLNAU_10672 [Blattamonas nauphoetae]|uniref:Uncharacterized protein n=1 Tax=Blattamonas nauphoetae TaxID=2049346 RepID=A0ABQ9XT15_9EUKA|nr:hypothetical protein BLNAU_10672 [Blattamonas nauphoetae]